MERLKRSSIETMSYIITSHKPWMNCEIVTDDGWTADPLTPSQVKIVTVVDRAIWNMIFGLRGNA